MDQAERNQNERERPWQPKRGRPRRQVDDGGGRARRGQQQRDDGGPAGPDADAGRLVSGEAGALRSRSHPGTPDARQGIRRLRHVHRDQRHHPLHQGQHLLRDRQADRDVRPVLRGRRRTWRRRRGPRHPRVRHEVLHRRGQLGHRRQQHPGLLPCRSTEVPRPQPRRQARPAHQHGQPGQQLGLVEPAAGITAPGHHHDERARHPGVVSAHARLRLAHLQPDQRRRPTALGEVPPPHPAGHQVPDRCGGVGRARPRSRQQPARPAGGDRPR